MTVWLGIAAGGLAIFGFFNLVNPWILLTAVFMIGTGFAFYSPAWTSIQPEIVSNEELPSASTLGGLQLNISGIIGPALGGLLLRVVNPNVVFAMNSVCFFLPIVRDPTFEAPKTTVEPSIGEFPGIICYRDPIRSLHSRHSDCPGPQSSCSRFSSRSSRR